MTDRELKPCRIWDNQAGESSEWYTPPEIFDALGIEFTLDPCSHKICAEWIPAERYYTKEMDGLSRKWYGSVWMNPPFGSRNSHVPWLKKFIEHGFGIGLVRAYTSSVWFHDWIPKCDAILFPRGKTKFIRPDGSRGKQPGHGIVLIGCGDFAMKAMERSNLGIYLEMANTSCWCV